jgi:diacylglycerol kinase (CTP)
MPSSSTDDVPATPRVISPSPVPSESSSRDDYAGPRTRSAARRERLGDVSEERSEDVDTDSSRSRSRSPAATRSTRKRRSNPMIPARKPESLKTNGRISPTDFLSPNSALGKGRWHDISRSPSPLGLIPLHTRYRNFIHRHEIPRKLLHVSIGFLTLHLYSRGVQTHQITPWLLSALVPIAATDIIRLRSETFNKFYIRCLGSLMRETEVSGYNGVIWYLLGAYSVLRFFPKDVAVMGVLLLSWCDTAASTFGRLYGRRTFQLRKGKSFAGTLAAWVVGVVTAAAFWGWFVPHVGTFPNDPEGAFMFTGRLNLLPDSIRGLLGWTAASHSSCGVISGPLALGVMSIVSGIVAAGSEFVDLFSWDDNFTIPVLSGIGLWGFLKVFG